MVGAAPAATKHTARGASARAGPQRAGPISCALCGALGAWEVHGAPQAHVMRSLGEKGGC